VYQVNLNFRTVNPYLASLVEGELLEVLDGPLKLYRTTEKGTEILEAKRLML
jgi:predicted transcriptional regulator